MAYSERIPGKMDLKRSTNAAGWVEDQPNTNNMVYNGDSFIISRVQEG